ncbi:uncharacterized protein G2W53_004323 [Senna tora]|uniref:Uncharacterized protein n=1 Tax=Senna tora TaxID=362788 RepID=A0A835CJ90_9FABA|nr:uncharacterized protein G2W53_004323 [Senna tora]
MCLDKTGHTFHVMMSPIRTLNPLGFANTTQSDRSPIRALNPLEFPYTMGSDHFDSLVQQA